MAKLFNNITESLSGGVAKVKQVSAGIGEHFNSENTKALIDKAVTSVSENKEKLANYFSESGLSDKLKEYGKKIGSVITYPVILLYSAFKSTATPVKEKLLITSC